MVAVLFRPQCVGGLSTHAADWYIIIDYNHLSQFEWEQKLATAVDNLKNM